MDHLTPEDLTLRLPRDIYYQAIHTLRGSLPLPVTDSPEDEIRRDNAAIAKVASLLPANGEEADIAAQFVAASAQVHDSLRLAHLHGADTPVGMKCTAQAASMMREARGARSLLMRVQAAREKREANNVTRDRTAWTEHCAIGLMGDALGRFASAPMAEPPPRPSEPAPVAAAEPRSEPLPRADRCAPIQPHRAAPIRAQGRLPEQVQDSVTSAIPILRAPDDRDKIAAAADEPRMQRDVRQDSISRFARSLPSDLIRWPMQKIYIATYVFLASLTLHRSHGPLMSRAATR